MRLHFLHKEEDAVKRHLLIAAAALIVFVAPAMTVAQDAKGKPSVRDILTKPADGDGVCTGDFGTSVKFVKTPSEAGRQALNEEKLVLVLHVSGQFEDPDFT